MSERHRHLALLGHAARNLARLWLRSVAVGAPLALAIAIATAATLIADGIRRDAALAARAAPDMTLQILSRGVLVPLSVPVLTRAVEALGAVATIRPRVFALVPAPGDASRGALATLYGADWAALEPAPYGVVEGRLPLPGETGVVVLGRGVAGTLVPGSVWNVPEASPPGAPAPGAAGPPDGPGSAHRDATPARALEVVGILSDRVAVHGANLALTSLADARAIAGLGPDEATELALSLRPGADEVAIADALEPSFAGLRVVSRKAVARILDAIYGSRSGAFMAVWLVLLLVSPATALGLGLSVAASERHEMGVLKALGWSTLDLVESRMLEGAFLGLAATLAGALAGTLYALAGAPGLAGLFEGWTALYPGFVVPLALDAGSLVALLLIGTLPLLAAMAVPAWRVGSTPPEAAMRDG